MSADHLARLVARTREDVVGVQPRVRSMFEPVRPGGDDAWSPVPAAGNLAPSAAVGAAPPSASGDPTYERRSPDPTYAGWSDAVGHAPRRDRGVATGGGVPRMMPENASHEHRSAVYQPADGGLPGHVTFGEPVHHEAADPGPIGGGTADLDDPAGGGRADRAPPAGPGGGPLAGGPSRVVPTSSRRPARPGADGPSVSSAAGTVDASPSSAGADDTGRRHTSPASGAPLVSDGARGRAADSDTADDSDRGVTPSRQETAQQPRARPTSRHPSRQAPDDPGQVPRTTAPAGDRSGGVRPDATRPGVDDAHLGRGLVPRDSSPDSTEVASISASVQREPGARTSMSTTTPDSAGHTSVSGRAVSAGEPSARTGGRPGSTVTGGSLATTTIPVVSRPEGHGAQAGTAPPSDASAPADAASATIRVTIGRVEVRAAAEPSPPSERVPPPAPSLSLEDHLRRRQGRP
jgi:hypothetical protein